MCGICGVYHFDQHPVDENILRRMTDKMLHRGPDDEGMYLSGSVGLAMRRLAIIDTHSGHQPITNEDQSIWVVLNGEIYNYRELKQDLIKRGHHFRTASDTEVLVHLYEEYGLNAIDQLNGMFAFALFDSNKRMLWLARDRLGIKPLYFYHHQNTFMFSSDCTALQSCLPQQEININAFLSYLAFSYVSTSKSIFNTIQKVPPGHYLLIDQAGIQFHQYWEINQFESWQGQLDDAITQLHELLNHAIQLQLRSDVPIGVSLSGGIDSSAIATLAKNHVDHLTSFTINYTDKASLDVKFARELAEQLKLTHHEITFSAHDIPHYLDELMPYLDEPIADSAVMSSYLVAKKARQLGVKVLLNGAGGDEIFGGYHRHHPPPFASTQWFANNIPKPMMSLLTPFMKWINRDKSIRMQDKRIAFGTGLGGVNLAVLYDILKSKTQFQAVLNTFTDELFMRDEEIAHDSYMKMYTDLKHYLVSDVLSLADKTTMAASVEGRVPLLDHRLVEFAFALPASINLLHNRPKGLFKQSLLPLLPKALLHRNKEGFNAPISKWMQQAQFVTAITYELVADPIPFYQQLFKQEQLTAWINRIKKGHIAAETIFNLYFFSRWYRYHGAIIK